MTCGYSPMTQQALTTEPSVVISLEEASAKVREAELRIGMILQELRVCGIVVTDATVRRIQISEGSYAFEVKLHAPL